VHARNDKLHYRGRALDSPGSPCPSPFART
jgi:hypothetical protein